MKRLLLVALASMVSTTAFATDGRARTDLIGSQCTHVCPAGKKDCGSLQLTIVGAPAMALVNALKRGSPFPETKGDGYESYLNGQLLMCDATNPKAPHCWLTLDLGTLTLAHAGFCE
jgi:hypothetical protein